jgi:hypothetical protein
MGHRILQRNLRPQRSPSHQRRQKRNKEVKGAVGTLGIITALFRAITSYAKSNNLSKPVLLEFNFLAEPNPVFCYPWK